MNRLILFGFIGALLLSSCKTDSEMSGTSRSFDIVPLMEGEWTGERSFEATEATYQIVAKGGSGWKLEVIDGTGLNDFVVTADYPNMRFTVKAPDKNEGETTKRIELKITYNNDIWKYMTFRQIPDFFSVSAGELQDDGVTAYTIDSVGGASYKGTVFSPGGKKVIVEYVSSPDTDVDKDTFTANFSTDSTQLSFSSSKTLDKICNLTAKYKVYQEGETDPKKIATIFVRQNGLKAPVGALVDNTAPGGYFYRMKYNGIDVAGVDLVELAGKTWLQIYYPEGGAPGRIDTWAGTVSSPNDPCPTGWRAMTANDGKRLSGGMIDIRFGTDKPADATPPVTTSNTAYASVNTGMTANFTGSQYNRRWLVSTTSLTIDLFPRTTGVNQWFLMLNTAGVGTTGQSCRMQVLNNYSQMAIESAGQTVVFSKSTSSSQWYTVRCVRDTPAN